MADDDDLLRKLFADQARWRERARVATGKAAEAMPRLLDAAEGASGQAAIVRSLLGSAWDDRPFELHQLRALDVPLADDAVALIDALRWGKIAIEDLVPNGAQRIRRLLADPSP